MNFDRIRPSIDVDRMQASHATVIGGAYGIAADLVRSGLGSISLVDFDRVAASNPARQDLYPADLGRLKVEAVARHLRQINPQLEVEVHARDFCDIPREEFDELFGHTDLFVAATDFFPAQARTNLEAVRLGKPVVFIGIYEGGRAGEIIPFVPGVTPACYRCICESRYQAFRSGQGQITSTGGTIFDLHLVDAIGGQLAVAVLTRGADNRFGQLCDSLGNRNLLQVKIDPEYRLGDRDIFAEYLGDHAANFSFTTIALPMDADAACPDCAQTQVVTPCDV